MSAEAGDWHGRPVLVTGGLGFIGGHLVRRLVGLGADVTVVDALVPGHGGHPFNVVDVRDRIRVRIGDVRDRSVLEPCVAACDVVFHLAGQVSHIDSMNDPLADLGHNAEASLAVLDACRRLRPGVRVVFTGTRQVYGRPRYTPVDEGHPCEPVDANGVHKLAAEHHHRIHFEVYGIPSVVLRLCNTYGPGIVVKHARHGFIGWFVRRAVEGGEIEIMGDGSQLRDLNHVSDVVEAMLRVALEPRAWGRTYNLGAPEPVSLLALAELLVELARRGRWRLVPFPPERKRIDVGSVAVDWSRIRHELGWQPRIDLRAGLGDTLRFYERYLPHYLDDPAAAAAVS